MDSPGWQTFLESYNRELLSSEELTENPLDTVPSSGWMGFDGATEEQILDLESRLDTRLPPSYRNFLATSNGWRHPGPFVYDLWPAEQVAWFAQRNQYWIDAYVEPSAGLPYLSDEEYFVYGSEQNSVSLRVEYLQTALQISEEGDSAVYLLNPQIVTPDGEWEAWFFANWLPGAIRYRSFLEMMQDERASFLRLLEDS